MHRLGLILSLLLACSVVHAQDQERKLMDRIMKPNTEAKVSEQNKSFYGGKGFSGAGQVQVKDFQYTDKMKPKEFATTGYSGSKSWAGDFKFSAQTANTTTRTIIPNADKEYGTSTVAVKDSRESGKSYATRQAVLPRELQTNGKSQKALDAQSADKKPMSIDEVRELLNKSK